MEELFEPSFCAYLDILGFRKTIEEAYANNTAYALLTTITEALNESSAEIRDVSKQRSLLSVKFFTDNIVIGFKHGYGMESHLIVLCDLIGRFQLAMANRGFFMRGGISTGNLVIDENIVFGDSLLKAHNLEATAARHPRVILDPALKDVIEKALLTKREIERNTMDAWLMRDLDGYQFVNYLHATYGPVFFPERGIILCPNEKILARHCDQVENQLKQTKTNPDVWSKYFWTANYHDSFCEKLGMSQCKINDSLLRPKPSGLR